MSSKSARTTVQGFGSGSFPKEADEMKREGMGQVNKGRKPSKQASKTPGRMKQMQLHAGYCRCLCIAYRLQTANQLDAEGGIISHIICAYVCFRSHVSQDQSINALAEEQFVEWVIVWYFQVRR